MANRRMFSKDVVSTDAFLDMPTSARALYYQLGMEADDDGFVGNPRTIVRMCGCSQDDMRILITKNFVREFDSGVIVLLHWKLMNKIQPTRYKATIYQNEMKMLTNCQQDADRMPTECRQDADKLSTQYSIGKDSIDQYRIVEDRIVSPPPPPQKDPFILFTEEFPVDVVEWAVSEAKEHGQEGNQKYIRSILQRIRKQGLKTLPEVLKAEEVRNGRKNVVPINNHGYQTHDYTENDFDESFYVNFQKP